MSYRRFFLLWAVLPGLAAGLLLRACDAQLPSRIAFAAVTGLVLLAATVSVARRLMRGELGVDVIALLAMTGALLLGQYLAGAVIAVMLTGGSALEQYAIGRARRELGALISRAPRVAHRRQGGASVDVPVDQVSVGEVLLVKPGEVVPVDGVISCGSAV